LEGSETEVIVHEAGVFGMEAVTTPHHGPMFYHEADVIFFAINHHR